MHVLCNFIEKGFVASIICCTFAAQDAQPWSHDFVGFLLQSRPLLGWLALEKRIAHTILAISIIGGYVTFGNKEGIS
jgi:hypothetical protein